MDEVASAAADAQSGRHSVGRFVLDSIDTITTHAAEAFLREDNRIRAAAGRRGLRPDRQPDLRAAHPAGSARSHPGSIPRGPRR